MANTYQDNKGIVYEQQEDGTLKLIRFNGTAKEIIIPNTYRGNTVTTIGEKAFYNCSSVISITIPNSVKKIDNWAFDGCEGLITIYIPSSVEKIAGSIFIRCSNLMNISVGKNSANYKSIEGNLYTKDGKVLLQYAVGKKSDTFNIPSQVNSIYPYAFWGNTSLKNIIANNKIGYFSTIDGNLYCNYGKELLQYACGKTDIEFTIPEGVEGICLSGCSYCKHLQKVNLPFTLMKIGYNSFTRCENLQEIVIPASVTEIEKNAFSGCKNLKTVYNLSNLDIQKGAETHGYVAYYTDEVFNNDNNAIDK